MCRKDTASFHCGVSWLLSFHCGEWIHGYALNLTVAQGSLCHGLMVMSDLLTRP